MGLQDTVGMALREDTPSIGVDDTLEAAINCMARGNSCGLVVMKGNELIGLLTELDLMHSVNRGVDLATVKVAEAMTPCELITDRGARNPCVQLDDEESVANALQIMEEAGIHNLLVSGEGGKIQGVATVRDLLARVIA